MKRKIMVGVFALASLTMFVGFTPAFAEDGESDNSTTSSQQIIESKKRSLEEAREAAKQRVEQAREAARQQLEEKKKNVEERTTEARKKSCEARKESISKRLDNVVEFGKKHKETFESIYEKVGEFKAKKNLVVENESALIEAVDAAKMIVEDELASLDELKGDVDCDNPDSVAESLEAFKSQAGALRDALKDYRDSIRVYMQAVKKSATISASDDNVNSSEEDNSDEEGADQ